MTTLLETQMKKFKLGDYVAKTSGSQWSGRIVGEYSTELTPEGYAVESSTEHGSVQIYPAKALELAANHSERDLDMVIAPPQREWVELTNEEIECIKGSANRALGYIRVTAAKLKEKNT